MIYSEKPYCPACHQEGCDGGKKMKPMRRMTEIEQRTLLCQFKRVLSVTDQADLGTSMKELMRRQTNPRLGSKRIFSDRIKLLNSFKPEIKLPEIPSPLPIEIHSGELNVPALSSEQTLAYSRALGILPKSGSPSKKMAELEQKVSEAIAKSGQEKEVDFHDITIFSYSLAIQCDKARDHKVDSTQLSHLLAAGYPTEDENVLKLLGEKCKFHDCAGKYVWRKIPSKKPKPADVKR